MRYSLTTALLGAFAVQSFALPSYPYGSHSIHEKRGALQQRWVRTNPVEPDHILPVRVGLKQKNLDKGMDYLMEVSDPTSANYGKHYTAEEVHNLFAPSDYSVESVKEWLVASGIPEDSISQSANKAWIQFDAPAEDVEQLLGTKYHFYEHAGSDRKHIGCDDYKVPHQLSNHIDFVTPGVKMVATNAMTELRKKRGLITPNRIAHSRPMPEDVAARLALNPDATEDCGTTITPGCIKAIYNITDGTLNDKSNSLGIFEFGDVYSNDDLDAFFKKYATQIPQGTKPTPAFVDGATAPTSTPAAGIESDLDFEMAYPIIYPQGTTLYQTDDSQWDFTSKPGLFNNFLDAIDGSYCTYSSNGETGDDPKIDPVYAQGKQQCGAYKPANVISFSYGLVEADYPANYQKRQCDEFMKLGLQGVSIVFASGDAGVSDRNGDCLGKNKDIFSPDYPDCPYITMVGATTLPAGSKVGDPEVATSSFPSGGGFSNVYGQPDYQADALKTYFADHNPPYKSYSNLNGTLGDGGGIYNRIGRGFPDVSALGDNGAIVAQGQATLEGGTSMAAPIVAAIFTRINEERIAAGKGPIGFANPTLYAHPEAFNDVTKGNQAGGGCGTTGFDAVEGWDPVTGLGTPKYDALLQIFLALK